MNTTHFPQALGVDRDSRFAGSGELCVVRSVGASASRNLRAVLLFFAALCVLALLFVTCRPACAQDAQFSFLDATIKAQVQTDGSLQVSDVRMVKTTGKATTVVWNLGDATMTDYDLEKDTTQLEIENLRLISHTVEGSKPFDLPMVYFQSDWRDGANLPTHTCYAIDRAQRVIYVFLQNPADELTLALDYKLESCVQVYYDTADLTWQYVGRPSAADIAKVELTVQLPAPNEVSEREALRTQAWGHGVRNAEVDMPNTSTVVVESRDLEAGQYAEVRILFPDSWMSHMPSYAANVHSDKKYDDALAEENSWSDGHSNWWIARYASYVGLLAICVLLVIAALLLYAWRGKDHKPQFTEPELEDIPRYPEGTVVHFEPIDGVGEPHTADLSGRPVHPAIAGRVLRWNHVDPHDLAGTIVQLRNKGLLRVKEDAGVLTQTSKALDYTEDYVNDAALDLLFGTISNGAGEVPIESLKQIIKPSTKEEAAESRRVCDRWYRVLSIMVKNVGLFDDVSRRLQAVLFVVAAALALVGFGLAVSWSNILPVVACLPTCACLVVIGNYMPRRTQLGEDIVAQCKAMQHWMRRLAQPECADERAAIDEDKRAVMFEYVRAFDMADKLRVLREVDE